MPRGLLFDLDDTLYAYAPCNEAALAAVHGGPGGVLGLDPRAFHELHDRVRAELARELAGRAASHDRRLFFGRMVEGTLGPGNGERAEEMYECYWSTFLSAMRPAPDAHAVLGRLAPEHALALVTNHTSDVQHAKVARLGFEPYFEAVVTSEDAGAEKPDPRPFLRALEALGLDASEAWMIGDDPRTDVEGARRAGLETVHTSEFTELEARADHTIARLGELPALLDRRR